MRTERWTSRVSDKPGVLFATIVAGHRRTHNRPQTSAGSRSIAVQPFKEFENDTHDLSGLLHERDVACARHDDERRAGNAGGNQVAQFLGDQMIVV